jgi:hypothetical protein
MIFEETILKYHFQVVEAVEELFLKAATNQTHESDILLILINGFYLGDNINPDYSPFVFGSGGWEYQADHTQYRFFDTYRNHWVKESRKDFFSDISINQEKQLNIDLSIQIELMIYLKFWESDRIIKILYELSLIASGKDYDWYFKIPKEEARHNIIRLKIRDQVKDICPKFYQLIKDIYRSQIRNAAAHSQFYIVNDTLGFTNYSSDPKDFAPLSQIKFEEWEEKFHKLILFYNELIGKIQKTKKDFILKQEGKEFGIPIRLPAKIGSNNKKWIKYFQSSSLRKEWIWYETWVKLYKYK